LQVVLAGRFYFISVIKLFVQEAQPFEVLCKLLSHVTQLLIEKDYEYSAEADKNPV